MHRLIIDQDIRSMSEFRSGVASFIKQVHETKRPLAITQHGKGVGVLLDVVEYEVMREKTELLEDIQTAISQLNEGQGTYTLLEQTPILISAIKYRLDFFDTHESIVDKDSHNCYQITCQ